MTTFSYTGKFASYTVESTGVYDIVAFGAQGGGSYGGVYGGVYGENGAEIGGDVTRTAGEKLTIAVGGAGQELTNGCGSFVVVPGGTPTPLIIAGGGSESVEVSHYTSYPAAGQTGTLGTGLDVGKPGYDYGIIGNGGYKSFNTEAGGGGFLTSGGGTNGTESASYMAGLAGGTDGGGFGSGGNGGFGGDDAGASQVNFPGGGGGSLDKGTNQVLVAGENSSNGLVVITWLSVTPSITGTVANQPATDQTSDMPFFGVTICDASTNGPTETVTITPSATANGALIDTNSAADRTTISSTGVYTVKGSAAAVTTDIEQLLFIPMPHKVALSQTVQTGFTTSDTCSNGYSARDSTSSVIVTVFASAITATPATETVPTTDEKTASPFSNVAINDLNYGQTETAVVSVGTPATGTLSDPNAATDSSTTSKGAVTITGSATAVATALDGLVFTPTAHQAAPGSVVATTITAAISDTAGQKTLIASTVDATESSSHNVINGPAGGRAKIYGISGNDQITAFSTNNTIYGEGGNNLINAGAGNAIVTLGGSRNAVSGGTGNTSLTGGPSGYNSVALGNGNDTATVGGTHDVIVLGGSGNTVSAGSGSNTISGGTGSNAFILPGAGQGFDAISGFTETNGNVLNLHAALQETNWNGKANTLGNYVKATDVGNNTDISIANTGMGSGVLVAQLTNTLKLGFADLISHNSISTGADAPNALERQHSPSRVGTEDIMYIGTHPSDLRLMRRSAQRMQGSSSRLQLTLSGFSDRLRPP